MSYVVLIAPKPVAPVTSWLIEWTAIGPFETRELAVIAARTRKRQVGSSWQVRVVALTNPSVQSQVEVSS